MDHRQGRQSIIITSGRGQGEACSVHGLHERTTGRGRSAGDMAATAKTLVVAASQQTKEKKRVTVVAAQFIARSPLLLWILSGG